MTTAGGDGSTPTDAKNGIREPFTERRRFARTAGLAVAAAGLLAASAPAHGALSANAYNRDWVIKDVEPVRLRDRSASLLGVFGDPLGTLAVRGRSINVTTFPTIGGPRGPMYLAFNSAWREGWGHVDARELVNPPRTCSSCRAGNGKAPPSPHDTARLPDGHRRSYHVRPKPLPLGLLYKNSLDRETAGSQFRNYGSYQGPKGNRAYSTERPDSDRHHMPMIWSTLRRSNRAKVERGGVARAFVSDGDIFYRSDVASVTVEACSRVSPCPVDDRGTEDERPSRSDGLRGRGRFVYGYTYGPKAGRQYGWIVEWYELGRRGSRRIQLLERVPEGDPNHR